MKNSARREICDIWAWWIPALILTRLNVLAWLLFYWFMNCIALFNQIIYVVKFWFEKLLSFLKDINEVIAIIQCWRFLKYKLKRQMLKAPHLKSLGLYISGFQDRPNKGRLICSKYMSDKSSKIRKKVKNGIFGPAFGCCTLSSVVYSDQLFSAACSMLNILSRYKDLRGGAFGIRTLKMYYCLLG